MSVATSLNPYAPPPAPAQIDFREAAVDESLRILEASGGLAPDELGVSLVLPADVSGPAALRRIARMTLLRLVVGIVGIVAGGILAGLEESIRQQWQVPQWLVLSVAGFCSLGGIGLLLANVFFVCSTVRRSLGDRYDMLRRHSTVRPPLCTCVEDARTFNKMKLAPEDFAYLAFDGAGRRLILEGLLFRYVIYAADVLTVGQSQGATTTGTQIVFRVGRVVVGITLQFDSIWHELKKQILFARQDLLLGPIHQTLSGGR